MAKSTQAEGSALNTLAQDATIKGDLNCIGDIRFDGKLEGNMNCQGKVVLGESAVVVGKINCKVADISGKIEGELIVEELASLKKTAKVNGNLTIGKIAIEPGADFNGNCKTGKEANPTMDKKK